MINRPLEAYTDSETENKSELEEREEYFSMARELKINLNKYSSFGISTNPTMVFNLIFLKKEARDKEQRKER